MFDVFYVIYERGLVITDITMAWHVKFQFSVSFLNVFKTLGIIEINYVGENTTPGT